MCLLFLTQILNSILVRKFISKKKTKIYVETIIFCVEFDENLLSILFSKFDKFLAQHLDSTEMTIILCWFKIIFNLKLCEKKIPTQIFSKLSYKIFPHVVPLFLFRKNQSPIEFLNIYSDLLCSPHQKNSSNKIFYIINKVQK